MLCAVLNENLFDRNFCKINSYISFFLNYEYNLEFNEKQSNFKSEKNILKAYFNASPNVWVHTNSEGNF